MDEPRYKSPSVETAGLVFDLLAQRIDGMTLGDLTKALGASRSSVYRILNSLIAHRLVQKAGDNAAYRLGPRVLELARLISPTADSASLIEVAGPLMEAASAAIGEATKLAVVEGDETITVHIVESPADYGVYTRIGSRRPLHSTAAGKAILANLPDAEVASYCSRPLSARTPMTIVDQDTLREALEVIRRQGYAEDHGESNPGIRALGVPVFGPGRRVIAAVSVPYIGEVAADRHRLFRQQLAWTADAISRQMGAT
jgi:IclR family acetate operon transcriptional repressor